MITAGIVALFAAMGLTVALVSFFVYKTISIYLIRRKYQHLPGPPTPGILGFYLGNLNIAVKTLREGKVFADLMLELSYEYGEVFKFQILDKVIVFVLNPDAVKNVLVDQDFPKIEEIYYNVAYPYNERYLGNGLITDTDKSRSKQKRHQFNPSFHRHMLLNFLGDLNSKVDILMERFRKLAETGTPIVFLDEFNKVILDIIGSMAFGLELDTVTKSNNEFNKLVGESLRGFHRITFDPFIVYKPHEWSFVRNYRKILRQVRDLGKEEILKRVMAWQDEDALGNDILTNLIKYYKNQTSNLDNMVDDFLTFFVAGQETTANTLSFCMMEIGRNPDVLKKLREEMDENLGYKSFIEYEDMVRLSYTANVFKETLRLWPPIPELARFCVKPFEVNGYEIPNGSWIQISTYVSSRYKGHFKEPERFEPERFAYKNKDLIKAGTYFPFSLGSRNCIGQNFAQMIAKVFLAKFIRNFDFKLDPSQNLGWSQEATLRPTDGVRCFLIPRTSSAA